MISGIYAIKNKIDGKVYIGSSVNMKTRKNRHFNQLRKQNHHSVYLQRAFNKHGESNFSFDVIEYVCKEMLIEREQFYIDKLKPAYNNSKKASSSLGVKHRPETIQKNKERNTGFGNGNAKITKNMLEKIIEMRKHETISFISDFFGLHRSTIGRAIKMYSSDSFKKIYSQKAREKLSDIASKKVVIINDNGKIISEFKSLTEAAQSLNKSKSWVCRAIKLNFKCAGYIVKYSSSS